MPTGKSRQKVHRLRGQCASTRYCFLNSWFFCGDFAARVADVARDLAVFGPGWNQNKACQTTRHTLALVALDHDGRGATRIRLWRLTARQVNTEVLFDPSGVL